MRGVLHVAVHPRDPSQVEGAARSILAQHQFHHPKSLITRFLDWVGHELEKLFSSGGGAGGPDVPSWVGVLLLAALVVILVVALVRSGAFRRGRRGRRRTKEDLVHETVDEPDVEADVWLRRAEEAEQAGDWREAVRCRYRAQLSMLVDAGAVTDRVGRTAGEHRATVDRRVPAASVPFGGSTDLLERTWYGFGTADDAASAAVAASHDPVALAAAEHRRSTAKAGADDTDSDDTDSDDTDSDDTASGDPDRREER